MSYTALSFAPNEILTSGKMNQVAANDEALKDATAIDDDAILERHIAAGAISPALRSGGFKAYRHSWGTGSGSESLTGVGFKPKALIVLARDRSSGSEALSVWGVAAEDDGVITQSGGYMYNISSQNKSYSIENTSSAFIAGSSSSADFEAAVTSFDADGITINISNASSSGQMNTFSFILLG